ncbi:MAG: thiol protease/hemagglutinin PrtT [Bacteroidales bacterium]|nr:thiol protease/hemagglutinin PrtT [Bacteroidales bacterium]
MFKSKRCFLLVFLIFLAVTGAASPIDSSYAKRIASRFLQQTRGSVCPELTYLHLHPDNPSSYYIFNYDNGFIIVAGDNNQSPILGYSTETHFQENNLPLLLKKTLQVQPRQSRSTENNIENPDAHLLWQTLESGNATSNDIISVDPIIQTTWGQDPYYNLLCPTDNNSTSGRAVAGCISVAMAQIINHHQFPQNGFGSHEYTSALYGHLSADFGNTTYDYDNMPNALTEYSSMQEKMSVATLIYHCGVAIETDYGPESSSAYPIGNAPSGFHALKTYFGYDDAISLRKNYFSTTQEWEDTLRRQLDAGLPFILSGQGSDSHTFLCDGYQIIDGQTFFHINWGWKGNNDGYFSLTHLNPESYDYTYQQKAIINLYPVQHTCINVSPNSLNLMGNNSIDSINISGSMISGNILVNSNDNFLLSTDKNIWQNSCALDSSGGKIYVQYVSSGNNTDSIDISITANGADSKTVIVQGYTDVDTIYAQAMGGGRIEPAGIILAPRHGNIEFRHNSLDPQHAFSALVIDGDTSTINTGSYTFENINGNHSITAIYHWISPHLQIDSSVLHFSARLHSNSTSQLIHVRQIDFRGSVTARVGNHFELSPDNQNWFQEYEFNQENSSIFLRYTANDSLPAEDFLILSVDEPAICDSLPLYGQLSPYNIYLYGSIGGHFEPATDVVSVAYGADTTIYFIADDNYEVLRVILDDNDLHQIDSLRLRHITQDHSIFVQYQAHSVGIEINSEDRIFLYPNPASNHITPQLGVDLAVAFLTIYDIHGQIVEKMEIKNSEPINISHLSKGSYIFVIEKQDKIFIEKVIKN